MKKIIVLSLCAMAAVASAGFVEDFEGSTVGSTPTGWTGNGIVVDSSSETDVDGDAITSAGHGKVLRLRNLNGAEQSAQIKFNETSKEIAFDFDLYNPSESADNGVNQQLYTESVKLYAKTSAGSNYEILHFYALGNYRIEAGDGKKFFTSSPMDTWINVSISIDLANETYDATAKRLDNGDALLSVTDGVLQNAGSYVGSDLVMNMADFYTWSGTNNSGSIYYDNVKLDAIPEPATLALLGIGGLLSIRRKRS